MLDVEHLTNASINSYKLAGVVGCRDGELWRCARLWWWGRGAKEGTQSENKAFLSYGHGNELPLVM